MKKKTIMGLEFKWEVLVVYLLSILGFIFSFMKDKEVSDDVRFHYNQAGAIFIVIAGLNILSVIIKAIGIPFLPYVCSILILVVEIFALVAVIKAFSDDTYEIPVISNMAKSIWK